jgi:hypothetical protein
MDNLMPKTSAKPMGRWNARAKKAMPTTDLGNHRGARHRNRNQAWIE